MLTVIFSMALPVAYPAIMVIATNARSWPVEWVGVVVGRVGSFSSGTGVSSIGSIMAFQSSGDLSIRCVDFFAITKA